MRVLTGGWQWDRLEATYPDGVCDYTKPAVGEQPVVAALAIFAAVGEW